MSVMRFIIILIVLTIVVEGATIFNNNTQYDIPLQLILESRFNGKLENIQLTNNFDDVKDKVVVLGIGYKGIRQALDFQRRGAIGVIYRDIRNSNDSKSCAIHYDINRQLTIPLFLTNQLYIQYLEGNATIDKEISIDCQDNTLITIYIFTYFSICMSLIEGVIVCLIIYYWYKYNKDKSFRLNVGLLTLISIVTIMKGFYFFYNPLWTVPNRSAYISTLLLYTMRGFIMSIPFTYIAIFIKLMNDLSSSRAIATIDKNDEARRMLIGFVIMLLTILSIFITSAIIFTTIESTSIFETLLYEVFNILVFILLVVTIVIVNMIFERRCKKYISKTKKKRLYCFIKLISSLILSELGFIYITFCAIIKTVAPVLDIMIVFILISTCQYIAVYTVWIEVSREVKESSSTTN